tara:strand:+ start:83 stop:367 length:285 start_codon:yes stop_codon:yes gene_type:complete
MFNFLKKRDTSRVIEDEVIEDNDSLSEFTVDCPVIKELSDNKDIIDKKSNLDVFENQRISVTSITVYEKEVKIYCTRGIITLTGEPQTWKYNPY